jgi:hypothetical protein
MTTTYYILQEIEVGELMDKRITDHIQDIPQLCKVYGFLDSGVNILVVSVLVPRVWLTEDMVVRSRNYPEIPRHTSRGSRQNGVACSAQDIILGYQ